MLLLLIPLDDQATKSPYFYAWSIKCFLLFCFSSFVVVVVVVFFVVAELLALKF